MRAEKSQQDSVFSEQDTSEQNFAKNVPPASAGSGNKSLTNNFLKIAFLSTLIIMTVSFPVQIQFRQLVQVIAIQKPPGVAGFP